MSPKLTSAPLPGGRFVIYFDEQTIEMESENEEGKVEHYTMFGYHKAVVPALEKGEIVNAIIRSRYTQSDVEALMRHKLNGDDGADAEFDEFNAFAERAKARAVEILNARIEAE